MGIYSVQLKFCLAEGMGGGGGEKKIFKNFNVQLSLELAKKWVVVVVVGGGWWWLWC